MDCQLASLRLPTTRGDYGLFFVDPHVSRLIQGPRESSHLP